MCDAIFRAIPFVDPAEPVLVGLPDTIWLPEDAFARLPQDKLAFLTFPVARPELFDAVVSDPDGRVAEIQVKQEGARSNWVWGAFRMPGTVLHELHRLWRARGEAAIHSCSIARARWRALSSFSSCASRLRFCSSQDE